MRIQLNSIRILRVSCFLTVLVIAFGHGLAQVSHASQTPSDFQKQFNLPQDPDALLKEILSRKEFTDAATESLLDRFIDYLDYLWRKALSWLLDRWPDLGPFSLGNESVWAAVGILLLTSYFGTDHFQSSHVSCPEFRKKAGQNSRNSVIYQ